MGRKRQRAHSRRKRRKLEPQPQQVLRKNKKIDEETPRPNWLKATLVVVAGLLLFSAGFIWLNWPFAAPEENPGGPPPDGGVPRAAILDGLWRTKPNLTFTENLIGCLEGAGFHVDLFRGENVTINLLRNIAGYELLILRLHSSINTDPNDRWLYLFSGELYTESKYVLEQLSGAVKKGYTFNENEPPYFVLNSAFLGVNKPEGLKDSIIILMGCNGTGDSVSIQKFFERGAAAYVAWTGYVDLGHSDKAVLGFIQALCSEKLSLKEAIDKTMTEIGADPYYRSILTYYPEENGELKLKSRQ